MEQKRDTLLWIGLAMASALLAIDPVRWLLTSWRDPSYQSNGGWYGAVIVGLAILSLCSSSPSGPDARGRVFVLFLVAAAIRLAGQMLAINILSALALAIDVFALATFLRLDQRRISLSPFWLSVFFLFCLPLAPILQRVAGFPLQMMSAEVACAALTPFFADLTCEGVRLQLNGIDVLVDLPCSGASGLLLMVSLWSFINVLFRPGLLHAMLAGVVIGLATVVGNGVRITLLAAGLGQGINTMEPGLHSAIGLVSLALVALPVVIFYRPPPVPVRQTPYRVFKLPGILHVPATLLALVLAVAVVNAPRTPLDRSDSVTAIFVPDQLLGNPAQPVPLTPTEQHYFASYGGTAQKAQFGPMGLNIVRTASPLRHLHSPATCLLGMGYDVRFLGTRFDPLPTSVYEATSPDGQVWTVAVSFVSKDGAQTAGVGEAVWSWLNGSSHVWQSVQRITPKSMPEPQRIAFEAAALAALDL
ncbi:exosortase T [Aliiroseovarius crassostreae]|uniref:exosortase T n=1 Tax=Aliiroseovarius crassostreae TaxID=154981 RepID=UPI0022078CF9|nr:exosortase T [Aliiroseovarius crassostreae]UWQ11187.1 exosortase T [Aliiroseovarius crassostreae]